MNYEYQKNKMNLSLNKMKHSQKGKEALQQELHGLCRRFSTSVKIIPVKSKNKDVDENPKEITFCK